MPQVLGHGMVIGKVAVVDQGLVHADKGMGAGRMPDPALGGVPLMGDPDVGLEAVQLVVLHHLLGIAHDLQDEEVAAVREYKGLLLAKGVVVALVDLKGVLIDEFVLCLAFAQAFDIVLLYELLKSRPPKNISKILSNPPKPISLKILSKSAPLNKSSYV